MYPYRYQIESCNTTQHKMTLLVAGYENVIAATVLELSSKPER